MGNELRVSGCGLKELIKEVNMFFRGVCLVSAGFLLFANTVFAQTIQVLRFLDNDEGAIVKTVDGKTKTIKVGDVITSCEFRVAGCEGKDKDQLRVPGSELKNKDKLRGTSEELRNTKHGTRNTKHKLGLRVTEISEGRIVLEKWTNKGLETVIIRVEAGKQKIERISKVGDAPQVILPSK